MVRNYLKRNEILCNYVEYRSIIVYITVMHMGQNRHTTQLVIGIAGGSGSGKTSVTNKILESLDPNRVVVIQHDSYYKELASFEGLTPEQINFDHPNSLETELLVTHIRQLREGTTVQQPLYNFSTYTRLRESKSLEPREIVIVEGILIFVDRALRELMDIKIFIDTDGDERLLRRIRRDTVERGRSLDSIIHHSFEGLNQKGGGVAHAHVYRHRQALFPQNPV